MKSLAKDNPNEKRKISLVQFISVDHDISWRQTSEGLKIEVDGDKLCEATYAFQITFKN